MREILNESLWGDLTNKVKSAKLNKEIEESLIGLIYRYYNDGEKCGDSRSDFYGYATRYCNELETLTDDNVFDIIYEPKVRYEKKLQTLVDYICDAYGKNSIKESKKSARKSLKESKNDIDFNNLNGFVNFKEYGDSSRGGGAFSEIKKLFEKDSSFQYIVSLIKDLESDFELTKFTFSSNGEINISFKEVGGNFEFFVKYEIVRSGIGLTNLRYF